MKKYLAFLLFIGPFHAFSQKAIYYPSAHQWEHKAPSFFNLDSNKIKEASDYAKVHETNQPKNLWLSQAMQFGKEPFSDPIGPMADRGPAAGIIIYKGYIIAEWGNPSAVEMTHSVTKSMVSSLVYVVKLKFIIAQVLVRG